MAPIFFAKSRTRLFVGTEKPEAYSYEVDGERPTNVAASFAVSPLRASQAQYIPASVSVDLVMGYGLTSNSGTGIVNNLCSGTGIAHADVVETPFSERFGELFDALARKEQGLTNATFAAKTDTTTSSVSKARAGYPVPIANLKKWGVGFGLKGDDLRQFIRLGHISEAIRDGKHGALVLDLLGELRQLEQEQKKTKALLLPLLEGIEKHRDKLPQQIVHLLGALRQAL